MDLTSRLQFFTIPDGLAAILLLVAWVGIGWVVEHGWRGHPSTTVLMAGYRRDWMRQFVTRQPRVFDASLLSNLRQGTTFFASACMIGIGGGLALIGNTERLTGLARDLSLDTAPTLVWEVKLLAVVLLLANALLKFIWSHRLFGYCAVVMASAPNDDGPDAYARAAQAAEINITAGRSFNRGTRSMYFALAALAWLLGAWAMILATLATAAVLARREFASHSRTILMQGQTR